MRTPFTIMELSLESIESELSLEKIVRRRRRRMKRRGGCKGGRGWRGCFCFREHLDFGNIYRNQLNDTEHGDENPVEDSIKDTSSDIDSFHWPLKTFTIWYELQTFSFLVLLLQSPTRVQNSLKCDKKFLPQAQQQVSEWAIEQTIECSGVHEQS